MRPLRLVSLAALVVGTTACDPPATPDTPSSAPSPGAPGPGSTAASTPSAPSAPSAAAASAPSPSTPPPSGDALAGLARGNNRFALELYGTLRDKPGNLVFSPASISSALAMTWLGAKGDTAAEMKRVMHFDGTPEQIADTSGALMASLGSADTGVTCNVANRLFGEKTYAFERPYLDKAGAAFGAALEPLDFRNAAEPSRVHINAWVEEKTEKRIQNLIPEKAIDRDMRLVLVNAIYFLGRWKEPFSPGMTKDEPFFVTKTEPKPVPLMLKTDTFRVGDTGDADVVDIPYEGERTAMLLVVPKELDGLAKVERSLDAPTLARIPAGLEDERVMLRLPRFEIAPATSLPLGDLLQGLGMRSAFDPDLADLTGIANPPAKADRLFIGQVFHKAFVKLDEKGTEAAAATAVMAPRGGGPPPSKPREIRADRPFLFFIRDRESGLVLFMGRVADPTATQAR